MRAIPIVLLALSSTSAAQTAIPWTSVVDNGGAYSSESAAVLALSASGDVVIAGGRGTNPGSSTAVDPFVARIDSNGAVVWSYTDVTAAPSDGARSIALSSVDGSIHVLSSPGSFGQAGLRLAKYDAGGTPLWASNYSASAVTTLAASVVLDGAGNTYVAGAVGSGAGAPGEILDLFLESRDAAGSLRWSHLIDGGAGKGDSPKALVAAPGGEFVVVGVANQLQSGPSDAWISRFDSAGNVLWTRFRNVQAGATHIFEDVAVDAAGTAYVLELVATPPTIVSTGIVAYDVAGSVLFAQSLPAGANGVDLDVGAGAIVVAGTQGSSAFGARYTTAGALDWTRTWSAAGSASTSADRVSIDAAGNATFSGEAATPDVQHYDYDLVVVRYAPDGTQLSNVFVAAPGAANDFGFALAVDGTGAATVAGSRRDVVGTNYGPLDALVIRFEPQSFPLCLGDGTGAACPCGNSSTLGSQRGCANSSGIGARLSDNGFASLSNDTLVLSVGGETPSAPTVIIQGSASLNSATFGDGFRCAGGVVRRMYSRTASSGVVNVPGVGDPSVSARAAVLGDVITPGSARVYQSYYRDPNPAFCPTPLGNTWNLSNGLLVRWGA